MWGSEYPIQRIRDVLAQVRRSLSPQPSATYTLIGVKLYAAGIRVQGTFQGDQLQAPTLNRIEPGDIVYNKMWASKGTFALVGDGIGTCFGTTEYPTFRAKDKNSSEYIFRVLSQPRFWSRSEAWSSGTTDRARLNPKDFLTLPIPAPEPAEQRAIADVLVAIESAIDSTETLISSISDTQNAVVRKYFSSQGIKIDWSRIGEIGRWKSGGTPATKTAENWNGVIPWVCPKDIKEPTINSTIDRISEKAASSLGLVEAGTLLVVVRGMILARAIPSTITTVRCAFNQDVKAFVPRKDVSPRFLKLWLDINETKLLAEIETATHGTKRFPLERLNDFPVPILKSQDQDGLVAFADAGYQRLQRERQYLSALQSTYAALAQELLSGRLRLPESIVSRHRDKSGPAA